MWGLNILSLSSSIVKREAQYYLSQAIRILFDNSQITLEVERPKVDAKLYLRDVFNAFQLVQKLTEKDYCKVDESLPDCLVVETKSIDQLRLKVILKRSPALHNKLRP